MAAFAERSTRSIDGPLKLRPRPARLEERRNFSPTELLIAGTGFQEK
jgi:hypothetical protein